MKEDKERMEEDRNFFERIEEYREDEKPTEEEIRTTEKVLKYAAQCNYIGFSTEDAIDVMQRSTNILKWNFGYWGKKKNDRGKQRS